MKKLFAFFTLIFLFSCGDDSSNNPSNALLEYSSSSTSQIEISSSDVANSSSEIASSSSNALLEYSSSSTSQIEVSSSSINGVVEISSSDAVSSSSVKIEESSSSKEASSSSVIMSEISSSDVANSSSEIASSSSLGCIYGEDIYDTRDGKTYKTVKIGEQEWMAENLNYHYIRGTTGSARYSCYGKEEENCDVYGALYPWTVAIDSAFLDSSSGIKCGSEAFKSCSLPAKWKGVCPDGWHLPSLKEWRILVQYIGDGDGLKLKSKGYWDPEGTDDVCFSAKPAGERESYVYRALGYEAHFWTSEMFSGDYAYEIKFSQNGIGTSNMLATTYDQNSVRCIKD